MFFSICKLSVSSCRSEVGGALHSKLVPGLLLAALLTSPFAVQAAWDATLSTAIPAAALSAASPVPDSQLINVHVSLKLQNKSALDQFVKDVYTPGGPVYGHYLTPAQFTAAYAPSTAQAQKVVDYLNSMGFSGVKLTGNRMLVDAVGSASVIQKAFNTKLVQASYQGRNIRTNIADMQVPDSLGGVVLAVLGPSNIENFQTALEQSRARTTPTPPLTAAGTQAAAVAKVLFAASKAGTKDASTGLPEGHPSYPPTAWDIAYDAGNTPDGSGSSIAIATYGSENVQVVDDLRYMERQFGLPYVPVEVREPVAFDMPTPTSTNDDEWDLDTQSSTAIAHNVKKLIIYSVPASSDMVSVYNAFATNADAIAGNMSYSVCEVLSDVGYILPTMSASDQAFEQAAAEGLSWHASTGDNGGVCNPLTTGIPLSGVPLIANYPPSSPYVVAVGGTALFTDDNYNYNTEIVEVDGGGGISVLENAPSWQQSSGAVPSAALSALPVGTVEGPLYDALDPSLQAVETELSTLLGLTNSGALGGNGVGRGLPDLSMNFGFYLPDSLTQGSADTIFTGAHGGIFGTSLSSPLAAGAWARLQSGHCNSLGFASPAYYALDTTGGPLSGATGFHDITVGTIGDYVATPGWDYATGFGSLDISAVSAALPPPPTGCNPVPSTPVAKLTLSAPGGPTPLNVTYDASASSDPSGDVISYYTIDYGDDTLPLQQTSPVFAAHTYSAQGPYTVSLTVRNSHGGVSPAATQVVTVDGVPEVCTVPGKLLVSTGDGNSPMIPLPLSSVPIVGPLLLEEGVPGSVPDPLPGQTLNTASVAEPANMPGMLVFTMSTSSLSTLPPLTDWVVTFVLPGAPLTSAYYVTMTTDETATPSFIYGQYGSVNGFLVTQTAVMNALGALDASSTYDPSGVITLVLPKSALGLTTGESIYNIISYIAVVVPGTSGSGSGVRRTVVNSALTPWGYQLIGNDNCADHITNVGGTGGTGTTGGTTGSTGGAPVVTGATTTTAESRLGGGALSPTLLLPLLGLALRRRYRLNGKATAWRARSRG